jgi:hypothetical protein
LICGSLKYLKLYELPDSKHVRNGRATRCGEAKYSIDISLQLSACDDGAAAEMSSYDDSGLMLENLRSHPTPPKTAFEP